MSKRFIKLLPLAAALAMSGLAHAGSVQFTQSVIVKYGDLDLGTKSGVKQLHARLRNAAKRVCSPADGRVLDDADNYDSCVSQAVTQAVADVGNANLTHLHRYGRLGTLVAHN